MSLLFEIIKVNYVYQVYQEGNGGPVSVTWDKLPDFNAQICKKVTLNSCAIFDPNCTIYSSFSKHFLISDKKFCMPNIYILHTKTLNSVLF
jgi:hypothetical protein